MMHVPIQYTKDDKGISYHHISEEQLYSDPFGLTLIAGNERQSTPQAKAVPRHFNFYSIAQNIGECGYFQIAGEKSIPFETGQVAIITPGTYHNYGASSGMFIESFLVFSGRIADHLRKCGIIVNALWEMGDEPLLNPIIKMSLDPSKTARIQAKTDLVNLLLSLHNRNVNGSGRTGQRIISLLDAIKNNYVKQWSVSEMSEYCHICEPHFRRVFKTQTGQSPKEYIEKVKMNQAAHQLIYTKARIYEIAESVGYSDPYHFNRRFKQTMGVPPGQYRRLGGKND